MGAITKAIVGGSLGAFLTASVVYGQNTVTLPQIVLTAKHSEILTVPASNSSRLIEVQSSNPSVATAQLYRANQIQIVAVAPGKTTIEFFDNTARRRFIQPVWVQAANATGGGGAGFDKTRTQLPQVVMLPKRTENVTVPGRGPHQLSSVTSSNPSVATARTNTRNTIQIYSIALGDTWVNFTDNASGKKYQVHVWVVNDLNFKPPAQPGAERNAYPVPDLNKPSPVAPVAGGRMDPCLVGNWISDPFSVNPYSPRSGSGILLTIDKARILTIDYSGMSPFFSSRDSYDSWTGKLVSSIVTVDQNIYMNRRRDNSVILRRTYPGNRTQEGPDAEGGPAGFILRSFYTCSADTLEIREYSHSEPIIFRRNSQ